MLPPCFLDASFLDASSMLPPCSGCFLHAFWMHNLSSAYWRWESGIVVFTVTQTSRKFLADARSLYEGGLLRLVLACLHAQPWMQPRRCKETWLRRNVYMDDIYTMSMLLHASKGTMQQRLVFSFPASFEEYVRSR